MYSSARKSMPAINIFVDVLSRKLDRELRLDCSVYKDEGINKHTGCTLKLFMNFHDPSFAAFS